MSPGTVLFDLDGTITDSAQVILASLERAFVEHELTWLGMEEGRALLGPPLYRSLPAIIGDELTLPVIATFRSHYTTTMLDAPLYDGVPDLLRRLAADGRRLAVASSKSEAYVRQIVDHHGLGDLFAVVGGDELDGSLGTKAAVIDRVLGRLDRPDPADVVMVGDRVHDVAGAREHAIGCVAVRWGYAVAGELEEAGPARIVEHPDELAAALGLVG